MKEPDYISCRDECGNKVLAEEIESCGWEYGSISKRYRCTDCMRALQQINDKGISDEDR